MKKNELQWIESVNEYDEAIKLGLLRVFEATYEQNKQKYAVVVDERYFKENVEEFDQEYNILKYEKDENNNEILVSIADDFEDEEIFDQLWDIWDKEAEDEVEGMRGLEQ